MISFKRKQGAKTPEEEWSSATRIIGFDGPKVVWGLNESIPVCLATDKIRPATQEQILAYLYAHGHKTGVDRTVISDELQQSYVDEYHSKKEKSKDEPPEVEQQVEEAEDDEMPEDDQGDEPQQAQRVFTLTSEEAIAEPFEQPPEQKTFVQKPKDVDDLPFSIRAALKAQRLVDLPKRPLSRQTSVRQEDETVNAEASASASASAPVTQSVLQQKRGEGRSVSCRVSGNLKGCEGQPP